MQEKLVMNVLNFAEMSEIFEHAWPYLFGPVGAILALVAAFAFSRSVIGSVILHLVFLVGLDSVQAIRFGAGLNVSSRMWRGRRSGSRRPGHGLAYGFRRFRGLGDSADPRMQWAFGVRSGILRRPARR